MSSETILHDTRNIAAAAPDMTAPTSTRVRFGEPVKFVPMLFVLSIIFGLSFIYILCHCFPLMAEEKTFAHGWSCLVAFSVVDVLLITCFIRAVVQHPGTIPEPSSSGEGDAIWEYIPRDELSASRASETQKETKRDGVRRHCKWCNKYKPDRCHHCRVCRMCILKMDHHCPWIYNCVGFKNFKYFVLVIMYAAIGCHIIVWTMFPTMRQTSVNADIPFVWVFLVLFGESLAGLMALLLTAFLGFHVHLMLNAMTTIEFCEKSRRLGFENNKYSRGLLGNVKAVLGDNILLWLLPTSLPSGDGMTFSTGSQGKLKDEGIAKGLYGTMHAGTGEAPDTPRGQVITGG